ncbi:hypothetical protein GCM10008955_36200 [Deinococcus malanensis]|uniref:RES domain-containing protein n=1 Tax=Deinococcus malanensis TaxID=1706855 RepID=A0ABQ2F3P9_9DEIO|nr:RES family NAD+ phosphorylase [Deinococcus malanensis]GGK39129.1 hypothetical protein GCM10008955_36200 [Deinococcus malanensis]
MILQRVSKWQHAQYATLPEHGNGAAKYGGRWNSEDPTLKHNRQLIYTSDSLPLAMLEVYVHAGNVIHNVPHGLVKFEVDETAIQDLDLHSLPGTWNARPETPDTQVIGDEWFDQQASPILRVPSVILPLSECRSGQSNYLINTRHPETPNVVRMLSVNRLTFDTRIGQT